MRRIAFVHHNAIIKRKFQYKQLDRMAEWSKALTLYSLAVTRDTFCYSSHGHALYQRQGPYSVLLVMYST